MKLKNLYCRYLLLVIFLLTGVTQGDAVFKERDFGKTIDVLCAELELKYKEQKAIMQQYEQNAKSQHQMLVATMQQIDQLSLILYSQSSEFTFDMAYACQQATDLYHNSTITHVPFDKIMARFDSEIERYDSLIYVLKHIAPAITDDVVTGEKISKAEDNKKSAIEEVADSIMQTQRATHSNNFIDKEHSATPQSGDVMAVPASPAKGALYVLNDREKKIRELCLIYADECRQGVL